MGDGRKWKTSDCSDWEGSSRKEWVVDQVPDSRKKASFILYKRPVKKRSMTQGRNAVTRGTAGKGGERTIAPFCRGYYDYPFRLEGSEIQHRRGQPRVL